jgi:hypothetical protein
MVVLRGSRWRRPHNKRQQHRAVASLVRWTLNRCAFWGAAHFTPKCSTQSVRCAGRYEVAPIFLMGQVFGSALKRQGSSEKLSVCPGYPAQQLFCVGQVA